MLVGFVVKYEKDAKTEFVCILYFHCKQNVVMVIKSVKMRQAVHVADVEEMQ